MSGNPLCSPYSLPVIADIPGLIEGASEGAGLGHYFLRHIERVRLIVHVVDVSGCEGRDPYEDYVKIRAELAAHSEKLADTPEIIVASKTDLIPDTAEDAVESLRKATGKEVYPVSSVTHKGLDELLKVMKRKVDELPPPARTEASATLEEKTDQKFTVTRLPDGTFFVDGGLVDFLIQNVTISSQESFAFFQKVLKDRGVIDELKKKGMKEGDVVSIGDLEFEWLD